MKTIIAIACTILISFGFYVQIKTGDKVSQWLMYGMTVSGVWWIKSLSVRNQFYQEYLKRKGVRQVD